MLLRRVNDLYPVVRARDEMDRMFDRFFGGESSFAPAVLGGASAWAPFIDVVEGEGEITVRAEVPGVDPKELEITVTGDVLTIAGEKKESSETKDENFVHAERRFGSFRRTVQLPTDVDTDKISAEHRNGVVLIHLKKRDSVLPKRIEVKAG